MEQFKPEDTFEEKEVTPPELEVLPGNLNEEQRRELKELLKGLQEERN